MIKTKQYVKLQEVLSRCLRHKLLKGRVDMESAILYTVDFMHKVGVPEMFEDKEALIEVHNFRGNLPCDVVEVRTVMDTATHTCLRSMTDAFDPEEGDFCHPRKYVEMTYKLQNTVIVTTIKEGLLKIAYKSTPVDENGFPLLIDNPTYLNALELYIKKEIFDDLYEEGEITPGALQNTQLKYAWAVGQLQSEMTIPSEAEMESLCRSWCTMLQRTTEFDDAFRNNGNREYIRRH